jgi:hypothetical protein
MPAAAAVQTTDFAPRHHFLKASTSGPTLVSTAASSPPEPSRRSSVPVHVTSPATSSRAEHENQATTSPRRHSQHPSTVSSSASSIAVRGVPPSMPLGDRVCLDPSLHANESHAHAHHPGLLKGADFCDAGAPTRGLHSLWSSPTHTSSSSDSFSVRSGQVYQVLPGGEVRKTDVQVAVPRHKGHSRAVKVRPITEHSHMYPPSTPGGERSLGWGMAYNKVAPFNPALEGSDVGSISINPRESPGPTSPTNDSNEPETGQSKL